MQTGPTCGFYCLEYAMAIEEDRKPDEENIKKMLNSAVSEGRTIVGEIFTSQDMVKAFLDMYNLNANISIEKLRGKDQLKRAIDGGTVIMPVFSKNKVPHYFVIKKRAGDRLSIYDPGDYRNRHINLDDIVRMNNNLKDSFSWREYFNNTKGKGLYFLIKDHVRSPSIMAGTIQDLRRKGKRLFFAGMIKDVTTVDTKGIFFVVKKRGVRN